MAKLSWVWMAVLVMGLASTAALCAEAGTEQGSAQIAAPAPIQVAQVPRGGAGRGQMSDAERAKLRQQMLEQMLDQAGLTSNEKAAAKKAVQAKMQAREALAAELTNLRRVANKEKPSDKELQDALAAYRAAVAQYRKKIEAQDAGLAKQLSLKGQVRCMSLGILDNGLGMMGMGPGGMRGPGGMPAPGSRGGFRPG